MGRGISALLNSLCHACKEFFYGIGLNKYIDEDMVPQGLIGKPVQVRCGPATVMQSKSDDVTGATWEDRTSEEAKSGELPV